MRTDIVLGSQSRDTVHSLQHFANIYVHYIASSSKTEVSHRTQKNKGSKTAMVNAVNLSDRYFYN